MDIDHVAMWLCSLKDPEVTNYQSGESEDEGENDENNQANFRDQANQAKPLEIRDINNGEGKRLVCDICLKTYANKSTLNIHKAKHSAKGHKCPIEECESAFADLRSLRMHYSR